MSKKAPAFNAEQMKRDIEKHAEAIFYSARYSGAFGSALCFPGRSTEVLLGLLDDEFEYR